MRVGRMSEMCAECTTKSGTYLLDNFCCAMRLIRSMKDKRTAAAIIERFCGADRVDELRKEWGRVHGKEN